MALDYQQSSTKQFEALHRVTEEYINWFATICYYVAYPEKIHSRKSLDVPKMFVEWMNGIGKDFSADLLSEIKNNYADMEKSAAIILEQFDDQASHPSAEDFLKFKISVEGFLQRIRRSEKDSAFDGSGIDETTGLRAYNMLEADFKQEIHRLSRQGDPFSILMAKLDDEQKVDMDTSIKLVVSVVKESMRPFDDAYYLGEGQFIIMLKYADVIGAQAVVKRLQNVLSEKQETLGANKATLSYCMVEPAEAENIDELISSMQHDLMNCEEESEAVMQLKEISPLERYVTEINEAK